MTDAETEAEKALPTEDEEQIGREELAAEAEAGMGDPYFEELAKRHPGPRADDEKMEHLMKQHAAKKVGSAGEPRPMEDVVNAWDLDDRDAPLVCPQCKVTRIGRVPKSWWALAETRKEEDPFWNVPCTPCSEAEEAEDAASREPPAPEVSEALELELPLIEEGLG